MLGYSIKAGIDRAQEKEKRMRLYVCVGSTIDAAKISDFTACSCVWTLGPNNPTERVLGCTKWQVRS